MIRSWVHVILNPINYAVASLSILTCLAFYFCCKNVAHHVDCKNIPFVSEQASCESKRRKVITRSSNWWGHAMIRDLVDRPNLPPHMRGS